MSLADFVQEHVFPAQQDEFVVRQDLLDSYTKWRQELQPIMQLTDLDQAQRDSDNVLPPENYNANLIVTNGEEKGSIQDCWVGWKMDYPDGNRTQPTILSNIVDNGMPIFDVTAPVAPRCVHYCFHYDSRREYDPSQLQQYLDIRAATTSPNDIEGLEEALKKAFAQMSTHRPRHSNWRLQHVSHENVTYNVFVAYKESTVPYMEDVGSSKPENEALDPFSFDGQHSYIG